MIRGEITGLFGGLLQGWALDSKCPDMSLAVEIFYDGVFGHLVRADEIAITPSLPEAALHGFVVVLKKEWLATTRRITARVANQGPWLTGAIDIRAETSMSAPRYGAGQLYQHAGLRLSGWLAPIPGSTIPPVVRVLQEGKEIAVASASQRAAFLNNSPLQSHAFVIDLPWELANGQRHTLEVVTGAGEPLAGSPVTVCTTANSYAKLVCDLWKRSGQKNAEPPRVLLDILRAHERLYPASFGFDLYQDWLALYQVAPALRANKTRCLVIVINDYVDPERVHTTTESVRAQRLPQAQIKCVEIESSALRDTLEKLSTSYDLVVPVWSGDQLAPHALDVMTSSLGDLKQPGWGYADHDECNGADNRVRPCLKPDWDETLFFGTDIITPGVFFSSSLLKQVFSTPTPHDKTLVSQISCWSDCLVRVIATDHTPIHVPWVLYHQKQGSEVARKALAKERLASLTWLAQQRVPGARVIEDQQKTGRTRAVWPLPPVLPKVSIIVPTRDGVELLQKVMDGLENATAYPHVEWLVVDNESTCPDTLKLFQSLKKKGARLVAYPKPFNYSAINNLAAKKATGELLLFLNNDIEIIHRDWLTEMVVQFQRPEVGIVGKKLLWPNRMVQHGGVVVGVNGLAAHAFVQCEEKDPGYFGFNLLDREQSAVTGACLMMRREDFWAVGGFDEIGLPVTFNDVDLCLKIRQRNQKVVITTAYPLIHNESSSRGKEDSPQKKARAQRERSHFMTRWMPVDQPFHDPYYHPALNRDYHFGPYEGLMAVSL